MPETRVAPALPAVLRPHLPLRVVVAMACLAQFMVVLDSSIVTLALPKMRAGLDLSASQQQWVVSGYLLTLGGFLLLAARAGDLFGRKRVFIFGAVVFTAASLAGGLATGPAMLLAARVVQGAGAAALAPTSLSLITASHTDEHQRQRALTLWSIMGGAAGLAGVVLGGLLTAELNWRWVLFVNIPLGAGLLAAALFSLVPAPARTERARLDLPGALAITGGIGALTFGLSQASLDGWGSPTIVTALVVAAVLLAGFVAVEATSPRPLIPLALFRPRGLQVGNLVMLCMGATMTAVFYFLSLYLQQALGYSALRAGLAVVPTTVILIAGGLASRRLVTVTGPRPQLLIGAVITAAGTACRGDHRRRHRLAGPGARQPRLRRAHPGPRAGRRDRPEPHAAAGHPGRHRGRQPRGRRRRRRAAQHLPPARRGHRPRRAGHRRRHGHLPGQRPRGRPGRAGPRLPRRVPGRRGDHALRRPGGPGAARRGGPPHGGRRALRCMRGSAVTQNSVNLGRWSHRLRPGPASPVPFTT
jgi:EmrB/QacA subfamily drug resistance transporter